MSSQPLSSPVTSANRDVLAELLSDKRSLGTRKAYAKDLRDFFRTIASSEPIPELVAQFLSLERFQAVSLVLKYKAILLDKGLAEATVNRRLAAIKSLVKYARQVGMCQYTLEDVKGEKIQPYRDTSGISPSDYKSILSVVNRNSLKGKRDYALLVLLWGNALRRGEVAKANIKDLNLVDGTLRIYGKGKGTQSEVVSLGRHTIVALKDWLEARLEANSNEPLFCSVHKGYWGKRLSTTSIYQIVRRTAKIAGIVRTMSPHRIRHSSITAALDKTDGNVRMVQKLSRHSSFDTLLIYDDNRSNAQKTLTDILDDLL